MDLHRTFVQLQSTYLQRAYRLIATLFDDSQRQDYAGPFASVYYE